MKIVVSDGDVIVFQPLKEEAKKLNSTNVVICTPGRFQQHLEQTTNFTADELKILGECSFKSFLP